MIPLLLFLLLPCSTSTTTAAAAPLSPRQLVLPGAGGTNYWWPPAVPLTSSTFASYIASSVLPSSSSTAPSSSALPPPSQAAALSKPFNFLYLIPVFAVVGLSILIGIIWLTHGCCTRKPKYRPPPLLPPPSFKAFRYEDIPPIDDNQCQHVKEYGFQCDCRLQVGSSWPSDSKHMDKPHEEQEDGYLDIQIKDEPKDTPGFRMVDDDLISSSSPLSQLSTQLRQHESTASNGSWMEKVVHALGSRFSSASGKDEDRYTAIPAPSPIRDAKVNSRRRGRTNGLVKKNNNKRSSNYLRPLSDPTAVDVLLLQKRRLQNHRESIASLPAGMVFSPPSVAFSVFGEEDATIRDKKLCM